MGRPKKLQTEPTKTAAWEIPIRTVATVKAYALAVGKSQSEIVAAALAAHLRRAIPRSGKKAVIDALVKTYGG